MSLAANVPPSASSPNHKRGSKMSSNQSLNHLLNFTLPPRQPPASAPRRSNRKSGGGAAYSVRTTERFVNAQYRFVMKPSGDYTVHFADPDIFFQWQDMLQVIIPRTTGRHDDRGGLMTCPICLSPPTAPRMTRCGHVFCFPCILHYLNVSDVSKWTRCPICLDSVNEKQLKCVKWFDGQSTAVVPGKEPLHSPGFELDLPSSSKSRRTLRMRLMQRPHTSTLSLPRSSTWPSEVLPPHQAPFLFLPDVFAFSKFMLATPSYIIRDLEKDLDDLRTERRILESMNDDLSILFVDAAEAKVRSQMDNAKEMDTESLQQAVENAQRELADIQSRASQLKVAVIEDRDALKLRADAPHEFLSVKSTGSSTTIPPDGVSRSARPRRNLNPPPPSTSTYYYYQSASGSPIFLHPLDSRILLSHFHNYASFPNDIQIEIEALSEGAVNADLRKRCKYLALPEGADVCFVEADLTSVVGAEALKSFDAALKTRRAKRKERLKKDDRAKMRAEEKEQEKMYGNMLRWGEHGSVGPSIRIQDDRLSAQPDTETEEAPPVAAPTSHPAGAWGSRSFASALHASPPVRHPPRARKREEDQPAVGDNDVAWDDMVQWNTGRKQGRTRKMLVLGGPSATRRH